MNISCTDRSLHTDPSIGALGSSLGPDSAGFTLLELMLAIGILGLILAMLWGSFSAVSHSKVHAENRLYTDEEGRAIMWQLSRELRGLAFTPVTPAHTFLNGEGHVQTGSAIDSISFSTFDSGHRKSLDTFGAERLISYSAAPNPEHSGWSILLRNESSALLTRETRTSPTPLADNVLGFHLRYFDGTMWHESWTSELANGQVNIPQAVSIDLELASPGGRSIRFSTRVFIPIAFIQR